MENSNTTTYNNCLEILNNKKTFSVIDMNEKYSEFKKKYPKLFTMLTDSNDVDLQILKFLCDKADEQNALNNIKTDENKDKQVDNDLEVGDFLAKRYIYNKFGHEPTETEKEQIKEQIKNKLQNK